MSDTGQFSGDAPVLNTYTLYANHKQILYRQILENLTVMDEGHVENVRLDIIWETNKKQKQTNQLTSSSVSKYSGGGL